MKIKEDPAVVTITTKDDPTNQQPIKTEPLRNEDYQANVNEQPDEAMILASTLASLAETDNQLQMPASLNISQFMNAEEDLV